MASVTTATDSVTTATIKSTVDATTEPDTETTETTGGDTALDNTATTVAAKVDTTADAADATQVDADATTTDTDTKSAETDATTTATTSSPNANMVTSATVSQVGPTEGKVQQLGDTYHTCESQGTNACETAIQQHTTAVIFGVLGLLVVLGLLYVFPYKWWRNRRAEKKETERRDKDHRQKMELSSAGGNTRYGVV